MPLFDPDWHIVPDAHDLDPECSPGAPLGFGGVLQVIQNLMNAGISIGILISMLVITFAGILWILTPTNPENHSKAKQVLTNAVIGLLIILSAWLIVDFVMKVLYSGSDGQQGKFGPWNEILVGGDYCIVKGDVISLFSGTITQSPGGSGGTGGTAGGRCPAVPTNQNNHCSVTSLQSTCFGSRATDASRICMLESRGGNPAVKSGSDRLNGGTGESYSVGLWQINLTVHKVDGLDCPSAFTMTCGPGNNSLIGSSKPGACRSAIKNTAAARTLYNRCVAAAQDPVKNKAVACRLFGESGFQPWSYSANICRVSH